MTAGPQPDQEGPLLSPPNHGPAENSILRGPLGPLHPTLTLTLTGRFYSIMGANIDFSDNVLI